MNYLDTIFIKNEDFQYRWKTEDMVINLYYKGILFSQNKRIETLELTFMTFIRFFYFRAFGVRIIKFVHQVME